jgi:putative Mg2+ transporter-C (MgtC) family protein
MSWLAQLRMLADVLLAAVLAGAVGWERESAGKQAGLRTHIVVGVCGALALSVVETILARYQGAPQTLRMDPVRGLEAVVTGVSFIVAGTIFVARDKRHVLGLTTGASVLASALLGCAVAMHVYALAIGTTVLLLIVLRGLSALERHAREP